MSESDFGICYGFVPRESLEGAKKITVKQKQTLQSKLSWQTSTNLNTANVAIEQHMFLTTGNVAVEPQTIVPLHLG